MSEEFYGTGTMANQDHDERRQLLQTLRTELDFFDAGGYGKSFRSNLASNSAAARLPACINFNSTGRQTSCRRCPLYSLVPLAERNAIVPCHHIPLDERGATIARLYRTGAQKDLDQHYRDWLVQLTRKPEQH
jgi:hypothetical protein